MHKKLSRSLFVLTLCTVLCTFSLAQPNGQNEKSVDKNKREPFGYSLSFLKWDPQTNRALDYSQIYKTKVKDPNNQNRNTDFQYSYKERADSKSDINLQTTLVVFEVVVSDKNGHYITGLNKNDIVIKEDNVEQEVGSFGTGHGIPRSIVLILDYSSSEYNFLTPSLEAAKKLVTELGPADSMAIVTDDVDLLCDYTSDKSKLTAAP